MKVLGFLVSSSCSLSIGVLLVCLVSPVFPSQGDALSQNERSVRKDGSTIAIRDYTLIPDVTEPSSPEASDWWRRVRKAGNDLYKKSDEKSKRTFYLLLYEGQQNGYRIPLRDGPPHVLVSRQVTYIEVARRNKIHGTVELSVEYRADASIGEIQVKKGLGWGLDEDAVQAARNCVFLPAVRDGAFVNHVGEVKFAIELGTTNAKKK